MEVVHIRALPRFAIGLIIVAFAGCDKSDGPTSPSPGPGTLPYYTVIGASDATGHGGSIECAPFDLDCADGTGYAQRIIRRYRREQGNADYRNLGVPGQVMNPALESLATQLGRSEGGNFTVRQAPFVKPETTMVTIFAGGNDANVIGEAVRAGLGGNDPRAFIDAQIRQWGNDYETLIDTVRSRAPAARIVVLNLPNMGAAPYVAASPTIERSMLQRIAVGLTDRANALTSRGVLVVDLMCEPRIYSAGNFSPDGFHPSDSGYALIAELAYPAVADGIAHPPLASCPSRTLLPEY